MKKNNIIPVIATIATAGIAAVTANLFYTPRKAEGKVRKVWDKVGKGIAHDLGLAQMPTIVFDGNENDHALMYVMSTTHYKSSMFRKTITKQETDYVIHINAADIAGNLNMLHTALVRDVSEEFITALFRHECRHLYQFQSGFNVGKVEEMFSFDMKMFDGYGADPGETDANVYAISAAENKKQKLVAQLSKAIQDEACKLYTNNTEARKYAQELRKMPLFGRS